MAEAILSLLVGLSFAVVLVAGLIRPKENRDDPEVKAKDQNLRLVMVIALVVAVVLLVIKIFLFR